MIIARFYTPYKRTRIVAEIYWGKNYNAKGLFDWIKVKGFINTIIFDENNPPWKIRPQIILTKQCR